ncbi:flagellar motor switch protein FliM [Limnobacter humi]|uniref:Flagellar motor switch protein FliM n=1 Tax=Limnobacter humi TaxID=1778671 RepID=A0ABT1WL47_9BURK|nr:flagellar motor switch protein FliM [Limnobacter humi]MCQ8897504.1 flagellar motor switch protein FliM [Limnobacter humi]
MLAEFLTQDEVDSLLRAITGEDSYFNSDDSEESQVKPYNLAKQERIVRGRMPTLEIINERFARLLRIGLFDFMRRMPEVTVGSVKVIKYNEFIRNLAVPTNLNLISLKPLRGNGLVILDPTMIFAMVDTMFGGDGRLQTEIEGREFSATEQRIIARVLEVVFSEYAKAWAPVYPLVPEYVRSEMHTQFANIANPAEIVVSSRFEIELGATSGTIHICIPYSSLEPIRDAMSSAVQSNQGETDRRWSKMLKSQMQQAEVELQVNLASTQLTVADVLTLQQGDFIPLSMGPTVQARVDNVPVFECSYGVSGGQYAVKVEKMIKPGDDSTLLRTPRGADFKSLSEVYSLVTQHGSEHLDKLTDIAKAD